MSIEKYPRRFAPASHAVRYRVECVLARPRNQKAGGLRTWHYGPHAS